VLLNRLDPYLKNNYKKNNGVRYLIKAAIESTGNLWINMYEALEHYGINGVDPSFWERFLHYLMDTPNQYLSPLFALLFPLSHFDVLASILK
jgi:hypothetical protein